MHSRAGRCSRLGSSDLRRAPTPENMGSFEARCEAGRALRCGSAGFPHTVCVVSPTLLGVMASVMGAFWRRGWLAPSLPLHFSRGPPSGESFSRCGLTLSSPRERGGLVGEGAEQFDSLTRSSRVFAQRNTSEDWKSESLRHNCMSELKTLRMRPVRNRRRNSLNVINVRHSLHVGLILAADWFGS